MFVLRDWQENVYKVSKNDHFFDSDEWSLLRLRVFKRDNFTCVRCDKGFPSYKLNAHHMIPRDEGGTDALTNLISLCDPCHDFVEINGFTNKAQIMGSYDEETPEKPEKQPALSTRKDDFERPEWHKYVYGGCKKYD